MQAWGSQCDAVLYASPGNSIQPLGLVAGGLKHFMFPPIIGIYAI